MSEQNVEAHRILANAVSFAKNMGALTLGNQHTAWSIADHLLWSLRNDGFEVRAAPTEDSQR